ncbi:MAG: putative membrane protein YeaQ/YmgE (transglycosylase-associated protein family) [Bacteroidia bacterium]|jgi:uncharacterized membrane protein YeaQ/YmgE (transglycosylase-associated protein family)
MGWFWYIILGALSGWLTQKLLKRESKGFIKNLLLGAIGGFVGSWIFKLLRLSPEPSKLGFVVTAVVGGVVVVWLADKLKS